MLDSAAIRASLPNWWSTDWMLQSAEPGWLVARMPAEHRDAALRLEAASGAAGRARAVADYIAGMTDRYAFQEHARLASAV